MGYKRKDILLFAGVFVVVLLAVGVGWFVETDPSIVDWLGGGPEPDCSTVSYNGDGTEANPYKVSNVEQLHCIEDQGLDANYVQVSDIDASETSSWNDGEGFNPIGGDISKFNGTLDGNGYEITDLTISESDDSGIFGTVGSSGKVTNVSVVVDVSDHGLWAGRVGGLAGANRGTIENSYVSGSVGGEFRVGGLVGINEGGTINESYATAVVESTYGGVGGLVGENKGDTIRESYATGDVRAGTPSGDTGGLVGSNYQGKIESSYATGDVYGYGGVGGLVGENINGSKINGSYATGSVDGNGAVGGIVGDNSRGTVSESYAAGSVEGDEKVGGLIGVMEEGGAVNESYWDIETTGQSTSAGGTGLTMSEMTGSAAESNMRGLDFNNTWMIKPNDYPVLAWQSDGSRGAKNDGRGGDEKSDNGESQGLPGFTVVTAELAILTVVVVAVRAEVDIK